MRKRKFWGWGWEDEAADPAQLQMIEAALVGLLGMQELTTVKPPRIGELLLRPPRVRAPSRLSSILSDEPHERAAHCYGKSYRDLVRAFARDFAAAPDWVAFPQSEAELVAVLDHCASEKLAAIPYGGGSSVCGGVEPAVGDAFAGAISIDMRRMKRVLEVDELSHAARIQAGVLGPELEAQLRPHGLTLRHYPQSFEFSSLGGWIATRSAGHFATLYTHIDELVEGVRVVTPTGTLETRRLPGYGAGPSAERLFIGSEGILGIISEAWMRLFERPRFRASATASFPDFASGVRAVRALAQSGLNPQNCRLLDGLEALMNGVGSADRTVVFVGFESHDHPLHAWLGRAAELCRAAGAELPETALRYSSSPLPEGSSSGAADLKSPSPSSRSASMERDEMAGAWRRAFLRAPYLRDELVARGVFVETFETAVTWDRFETLHAAVMEAAGRSARETGGGSALVTCRITHVYPDGAAPYFTVVCPARRGAELLQWQTIKSAITEAMLHAGGTVTHHHAVGRDFRPWYERQRPEGFARALAGAKTALDPRGIMNPGVLLGTE